VGFAAIANLSTGGQMVALPARRRCALLRGATCHHVEPSFG
jgi:hypothetical protein